MYNIYLIYIIYKYNIYIIYIIIILIKKIVISDGIRKTILTYACSYTSKTEIHI